MWAGFAMVLIAAGLAGVPRELLEAARVDGANEWQVFRKITVPLLAPVLGGRLVTLMINVLKIFDLVYIIAPGATPGRRQRARAPAVSVVLRRRSRTRAWAAPSPSPAAAGRAGDGRQHPPAAEGVTPMTTVSAAQLEPAAALKPTGCAARAAETSVASRLVTVDRPLGGAVSASSSSRCSG